MLHKPNDPLIDPACFSLTLCGDGMSEDEVKALIESDFFVCFIVTAGNNLGQWHRQMSAFVHIGKSALLLAL